MTIDEMYLLMAESAYVDYINEINEGTCATCAQVLADNTPFCNYCGEVSANFSCPNYELQPQE